LRLTNPTAAYRLSVHSTKTFVPLPREYTFSVYARGSAGAALSLSVGWSGPRRVQLGEDWQRCAITYAPTLESQRDAGLSTGIWLSDAGVVDVAAPQLEEGNRATQFELALADDHPLPLAPWPESDVDVVASRATATHVGLRLASDG